MSGIRYSHQSGDFVTVKHGTSLLPAVVSDVPVYVVMFDIFWIHFVASYYKKNDDIVSLSPHTLVISEIVST